MAIGLWTRFSTACLTEPGSGRPGCLPKTTRSARADRSASARPGWPCTTSWLTGAASAMGRVAALMTAKSALTPLQHRMIGVGRALAAAVVLCAIVLAIGLGRGQPTELMVI